MIVRVLRRYAAFVWIAVLALAALGVRSIFALPSGIYPEMEFPRVVVVAHAGQIAAGSRRGAGHAPARGGARGGPRRAPRARAHDPRRRRALAAAHRRGRSAAGAVRLPGRGRSRRAAEGHHDGRRARAADLGPGDHVQPQHAARAATTDPRRLRDVAERIVRPAIVRVPGVGGVELHRRRACARSRS